MELTFKDTVPEVPMVVEPEVRDSWGLLQAMEVAGIQPNRRFIGGSWRHESFSDECYEILSKPGEEADSE
jgi:hypothetical protein